MAHKFVAFGQDAAGGMTTRPSSEHSVVLRRSVLLTVESYLSSVSVCFSFTPRGLHTITSRKIYAYKNKQKT